MKKSLISASQRYCYLWSLGGLFMMMSSAVEANWLFDGTLVLPPACELGQTDLIRVSFGKVGVRKVDGNLFKQDIPYKLNCQGDLTQPWNVTLTFSGVQAGTAFDDATLQASSPLNNGKLGIQIQKDGIPLTLNKAFTIDSSNPPILSAVPIKRAGAELVGDNFTAVGTLTIDFQ